MKSYRYFLLLTMAFGCKIPYQPKVNDSNVSYLVIEGVINSNNGSTDSTFIKLSHTINLSAAAKTIKPETRAVVSVEDGQGYNFALRELSGGQYVSGPLGLDNTKKYRLRIKTNDGKTYLSDLEPIVYTPPIDSIGYKVADNGVQLYTNTHNPADNTRYYRWDFLETWKFHAAYESKFMVSNGRLERRPDDKQIYYCYGNAVSNNVTLASSAKLTKDVIYQAPIANILPSSEKISLRYSMLLKQYGLTQEAFKFWELVKKNTEQIGSIFDAQPSQIIGNIHCITDPAEVIFGYISITNIQTKRVYINRGDLPASFAAGTSINCTTDTALVIDLRFGAPAINTVQAWILSGQKVAIDSGRFSVVNSPVKSAAPTPNEGYTASSQQCVDCTTRGVVKKPPFWVD